MATAVKSGGKGLERLPDIVNVMVASAALGNEVVAMAAIDVLSMWSELAPDLTAVHPSLTSSIFQVSPSLNPTLHQSLALTHSTTCRVCAELLLSSFLKEIRL